MKYLSGYEDRRIYFNDFGDNNLAKYGYNQNKYNGYEMTNNMTNNNFLREYSNSPNSVDRYGSLSFITPYAPVLNYQLVSKNIISPLKYNDLTKNY